MEFKKQKKGLDYGLPETLPAGVGVTVRTWEDKRSKESGEEISGTFVACGAVTLSSLKNINTVINHYM